MSVICLLEPQQFTVLQSAGFSFLEGFRWHDTIQLTRRVNGTNRSYYCRMHLWKVQLNYKIRLELQCLFGSFGTPFLIRHWRSQLIRIVLLPFDEFLLAPPTASISTAVAGDIDEVKVNNDVKSSLLFCPKIHRDFDLGALRAVFPVDSPPL